MKILKAFYRTSAKSHLQLTIKLDEIIIGSMLGDLTAEKRNKNSNTRLQGQPPPEGVTSLLKIVFILIIYIHYFKNIVGRQSLPIIMSKFDSRPNKMKDYTSIKFQTLPPSKEEGCLPCFNKYRELFYNSEGIKIVPNNLESNPKGLTAKGLAYWIMDDGYKSNKGFYICTESFNLSEHQLLINVLKNNFNLDSNVHQTTNGYRLYIFSTSKDKLIELIKPYLINHFYYKFEL